MQMFKVSFSNQQLCEHVSGEINLNAITAKQAIKKAASIVSVPGGAFLLAQPVEPITKKAAA